MLTLRVSTVRVTGESPVPGVSGGRKHQEVDSRLSDGGPGDAQPDQRPRLQGPRVTVKLPGEYHALVTILIDAPIWPAHDTLWAHLVSDESYAELHAFATSQGISRRAFDNDHYDVPAERQLELIAAGALLVGGKELAIRLAASGLRVAQKDKLPR